ncbi:mitochondrial protein [Coprinopsis cinerea okayama7|uniref:Mitochondrial protein n=1 Tax=Coprinopsis cinerea (strain Okayama-7 / 130 / ATCC MYA-4618 / FGSC 9003) TaxID=240176 RepID=A8NJ02_COPC7|nr:mitochondrial protein [Coprinopsis cinerea okayama7\|eukprot:XP_001834113.2 mitochondrial protein [Coprinopsis cinerea okayama7\
MVSLWPWSSRKPESPPEPQPSRSTTNRTISIWGKSSTADVTDTSSKNGWLSWPWNANSRPLPPSWPEGELALPAPDVVIAKTDAALSSWTSSPTVIAATSAVAGGVLAVSVGFMYGRYGKRLQNSHWITPDWLGGKRWVRGVVTSVGDADNFRLFHTPLFGGYHWPLKLRSIPTRRELKDETLHIRLAGVDAPEISRFGKPGQPGASEALEWLSKTLLNRKVYCQLARRDQYHRIVAHVYLPYRFIPGFLFKGENVACMMLEEGHACVYEQLGAEYGSGGKEAYLKLEEKARQKRRGQWASGKRGESPAEYKQRHAKSSTAGK